MLVGGRKLGGILLETRLTAGGAAGSATVVLGIGLNLTQRLFPAEIAERATSVWLATGRRVDRDALLSALVAAVGEWRRRLEHRGFAPVRERWRALSDTLGRTVTVDGVSGVAVDIDVDGALVVQRRRGAPPPRGGGGRGLTPMLLTLEVGNTNTKVGVYDGPRLVVSWRLTTRREQTADEYGLFIETLLRTRGLDAGLDPRRGHLQRGAARAAGARVGVRQVLRA